MSQKLYHKNIGMVEFEGATWQDGPHHIGRLKNGAWVHITGLPIQTKQEIRQAITGSDPQSRQALEEALNWFEHRLDDEQNPGRAIMFTREGVPVFEDGSFVEDSADIIEYFKTGPVLDGALAAFYKNRDATVQADLTATKKAERTMLAGAERKKAVAKPPAVRGKAQVKGPAKGKGAALATSSPAPEASIAQAAV